MKAMNSVAGCFGSRSLSRARWFSIVASPVSCRTNVWIRFWHHHFLGAALVIGKAIANFAMLLVVEFVSLIVFGIFYDVHWLSESAWLSVVFALATWGVAILGAVFGAFTVNLRLRELMLPVIIYPLMIPLLIAAIELTNAVLSHQPISGQMQWIRVLIASDIGFTTLAWVLADTILVN